MTASAANLWKWKPCRSAAWRNVLNPCSPRLTPGWRKGFPADGLLRQHGAASLAYKARADFSRDFLRAGGLDVVYPSGFQTPEDAARAAAESGCAVCVICSTDDTYPEIVPAFCKALRETRPDMMVALAGYPADYVEAFKEAGVDIFIHVKANCYQHR